MLYCPNCQSLCSEEDACPFCGNRKLRQPEETDPVLLMTADETKAEMIEMVLQDAGILFEERTLGPGGPPSVLLGHNQVYLNKNLFVPYGELEHAREIVAGLFPPDGEEVPAEDEEAAESPSSQEEADSSEEEKEEMSPRKRTAVRLISVVLFLLVIWAVVSVSDYAANALKDFLANL
jgi:hypothetical protein